MQQEYKSRGGLVMWLAVLVLPTLAHAGAKDQERTSRISDDAAPLIDPDQFPQRPKPILELGNPFLGTGKIAPGIELPGGAVWQPSVLVFGTYRSAVQAFHDGDETASEWANRLDLFANLQLSGTERALFGARPLDEDGHFTGMVFDPNATNESGFEDEYNFEITTLFFEGDLGELIPDADPYDTQSLDLGFAVGRQPLFFQEGILINDDIDAIGITRNTLLPTGGTDLQILFIYGWNNIHRDDNIENEDLHLFGFFMTGDFPVNTINADFVYVHNEDEDTDGAYWGVSSVQRIGHFNASIRALGSHALDVESDAVSSGYLLFGEVSWTPAWTHDNVYVNAFCGIDQFASAARGPATGGPLGRTGILFAAVGIGQYGAALGNRADESVGAAIGYQIFIEDIRKQVIFELGGRQSTDAEGDALVALGARYQQAIGQHMVLQLDAFTSHQESRDAGWGSRVEIRYEF